MKYSMPILFITAFSNLSMQWYEPSNLLSDEDYKLELAEKSQSGISHPDTDLSSPVRWQCFHKENIQATCLPEDEQVTEDTGYTSAIEFDDENEHHYFFELEYSVSLGQCRENISKWNQILNNEPNFCLFASYWPTDWKNLNHPFDYDDSYWVVFGVKTPEVRFLAPVFN